MGEWVIFGYGNYLSDIMDIIHMCDGRVAMVVNNIEPTTEQRMGLDRRLSLAAYPIPVVDLRDFEPRAGYECCYGFVNGRDRLIGKLQQSYDLQFPALVHPDACLGSNIECGEGVIIGPGAVIAPNCVLGAFSLVNRAASIGHDTVLGEYATVGPGANIAGMARIGRRTTVGIGATIIDGLAIGEGSLVGAGAVVVGDVPDGVVVVGVPAKVIRKNDGRRE